jgi:hypothetical protein
VPIEGEAAKAYLQSIGAWDEARNAPREDATFTGGYDTETQRLVVLIPSSDPAAPPPDPVVDDVDRSDRPVYSGEPAQSQSSTGTSAPIGMVANVMNQTLSGQGIWGAPPLSGSPLGVPDAAPGDIPLPSSQPLAQQTHQADFTPDENPGGVQATRQVNALEDAGVPAQTVTDQNGNVYVRPPRPEDVPYGTDLGYRTTVITRPDGTRLEVVDPNAPIRVNRPDEGATE